MDRPENLDALLRKLIGDYMKPIYVRSPHGLLDRMGLCCSCQKTPRVSDSRMHLDLDVEESRTEFGYDPEEMRKEAQEIVYRDLFIWSILTNRIEMSKVILSHMQTRICAALIASKILKSYVHYAHDNESKDVLRAQAEQFEEYACDSLKCCYNFDEETACEIAIRRIDLFGGVSCLQVAVDADDKNFVGQPCCDQLLTNIWFAKMEPSRSSTILSIPFVFSVATLGLFAPFLLAFREEKCLPLNDSNDRRRSHEMAVNIKGGDDDDKDSSARPKHR